jgi:hypothetical protein
MAAWEQVDTMLDEVLNAGVFRALSSIVWCDHFVVQQLGCAAAVTAGHGGRFKDSEMLFLL